MPLRRMRPQDKSAFFVLDSIIFPGDEWQNQHFDRYFSPLCFVSYDETKQIINGYIFAHLQTDAVHITNLGVHPSCRSEGIGSDLMKRVIDLAQVYHTDRQRFILQVLENNTPAIEFYRRHGFIFDTQRKVSKDYLAMRRSLIPVVHHDSIQQQINRLRRNACHAFSIGNAAKADLIEVAIERAYEDSFTGDLRLNRWVRQALASHRICGFFGLKKTTALQAVDASLSPRMNKLHSRL